MGGGGTVCPVPNDGVYIGRTSTSLSGLRGYASIRHFGGH